MSLEGLVSRASNRIVSLDDPVVIADLQSVLASEAITFVIGSGVSLFPEASVVNGQRVTKALACHLSTGLSDAATLPDYIASAAFEVILQYNDNEKAIRRWLLKLFASEIPKRPNSVHNALASLLAKRPAYVVTTNYDQFIERALRDVGADFSTIILEQEATEAKSTLKYFKIHGCVSDPESLVFKLDQERPLQGWKAQTFKSLTEGRTVVLIGYSGKDFEICPALYEADAKAILWNALPQELENGKFPSENAAHLFSHLPNMLFMSGDMHNIFQIPSVPPAEVNEPLLDEFLAEMTPAGVARWQAAVLDVIGAPRQTMEILEKFWAQFDPEFRLHRLVGVAYRRGKYRTAIRYGFKLALVRSAGKGWSDFALRAGLDAAFKLRNRSNHRLAKLCFWIACAGWKRSHFSLRREYAKILAWFEILDCMRFPYRSRLMRRRMDQAEHMCLHQGDWGLFYLIRDVDEQAGPTTRPRPRKRAPSMPSQLGFRHIGNIPAAIDAAQHTWRKSGAVWLQVESEIKLAYKTELYPEVWKSALAALEIGGWTRAQANSLFRHLWIGLWKCQYTTSYEASVVLKGFLLLRRNRAAAYLA
jgi:hypothetical protein